MFRWIIGKMVYLFEPEDKRKVDFFDLPIEKPKKRPYVRKTTPRKVASKMPLKKSTSAKAFKENIKTEVKEGGKPVKQAVAIAYAVKREAAKTTKPKRK